MSAIVASLPALVIFVFVVILNTRDFSFPAIVNVCPFWSTAVAIPWNGVGRVLDFAGEAAGDALAAALAAGEALASAAAFFLAEAGNGSATVAARQTAKRTNVLFFICLICFDVLNSINRRASSAFLQSI